MIALDNIRREYDIMANDNAEYSEIAPMSIPSSEEYSRIESAGHPSTEYSQIATNNNAEYSEIDSRSMKRDAVPANTDSPATSLTAGYSQIGANGPDDINAENLIKLGLLSMLFNK